MSIEHQAKARRRPISEPEIVLELFQVALFLGILLVRNDFRAFFDPERRHATPAWDF